MTLPYKLRTIQELRIRIYNTMIQVYKTLVNFSRRGRSNSILALWAAGT
jgi:adenylate cyclase